MAAAVRSRSGVDCAWHSQPGPQTALLACPVYEVFFGGARGGGKTDGMLGDWLEHSATYGQHATGVFFRRVAKQLEEVVARTHQIFPQTGAIWLKGDQTWVWVAGPRKGARLKFRHLWSVDDAASYQGHQYTWICFEELTNWPIPDAVDMLKGTLRSAHGVPCFFRATGNPGGAGHAWVKARYVDPAPLGNKIIIEPETGLARVYIPSKLEDNRILVDQDPHYELRLRQTGSPELVKAWRFGIWDIVAGAFFDDVWNPGKHILKPFAIPPTWRRRQSFDWGSSSPASLGMWAESDGERMPEGVDLWFPRGSLIRTGEWYTVEKDSSGIPKTNVGQRINNKELGKGIARRSKGTTWSDCMADPSIFVEAGGDSLYDQIRAGAKEEGYSLFFQPADNSRKSGWQTMRTMLQESAKDHAEDKGLWIFENCTDWIRTVPVLQRDKRDGDDIDTTTEDHAADETRYICQTKPKTAGMMNVTGT